jgi:D-threo-aldose 1-dehydrogenase
MALQTIQLRNTPVATSALGLGTTGLLGLDHDKDRMELLTRAFSLGLRHFDTAPYYGFGEAERILGRFIRSRRDRVTVTTKLGIHPPRVAGLSTVAGLAKRMTRRIGGLRRLLSREAGKLIRRNAFTVADAEKSLHASLRALGTDYVDIYLLHEASASDVASDELLCFLEDQVGKGTIRCFGVASEFDRVVGVLSSSPSYARVVQFESSLFRRNVESLPKDADCAVITHRALHDPFRRLVEQLREDPLMATEWSATTGVDCGDESVLSALALAYAIRTNRSGIVLFSSKSVLHVESNVRAVAEQRLSESQIVAFSDLVAAHAPKFLGPLAR